MKTKSLFILVLLLMGMKVVDDYKTLYYQAFDSLKRHDYKTAIGLLVQSYRLNNNSKTAYYLALSFYKIQQWDQVVTYASLASQGQPPLNQISAQYDTYCDAMAQISNAKLRVKTYLELMDYYDTDAHLHDMDVDRQRAMIEKWRDMDHANDESKLLTMETIIFYNEKTPYDYRDPHAQPGDYSYDDTHLADPDRKINFLAQVFNIHLTLDQRGVLTSGKDFKYRDSDLKIEDAVAKVDSI